ncbi:hypothetical protein LB533_20600 [Mesorhizobium sp. BR1-1-13]|uniref:hypothetical protein n=1 Tax=Mesorhizobium sp. BR1-1-13 TaxID=2876656 RepID=UPI001CD052F3|nr:hypothetical protein [Mesorhizobium sp. BR1-1-13]MBZ9943490.1 hypothetical protein [Mesorhizobium sp. BR1-1-13]
MTSNTPALEAEGLAAAKKAFDTAMEAPNMIDCPTCAGRGSVHGDWCPRCGGGGVDLAEGEETRPLAEAISAYLASSRAEPTVKGSQELEEMADGAYGDNPMVRGAAKRLIEEKKAKASSAPPSLPVGDDLEGLRQAFDRLYAECDLAFANELGRPIADALANLRALRASRDGYVKQATAREAEHDRQLGALRAENERLKTGADAYSKCKDLSKQGWVALTDARQFLDLGHTSDIEEAKQCVDLALASFADTIISSEARAEAAEAKLEEARKALKPFAEFAATMDKLAVEGQRLVQPDAAANLTDDEIARLVTPDDATLLTDGRMRFGGPAAQSKPAKLTAGDFRRAARSLTEESSNG